MAMESLVAYAALAATLTLTPGPNMALVLKTALESGTASGLIATLGVATGLAMWALASALGLAAVLQTSPEGFTLLQAAGGVWLVFLGVRALPSSDRPLSSDERPVTRTRRNYWAGLLTNLLNPMVGAFYLAALPGFVPSGPMAPITSLLLAGLHIAMVATWLSLCSVLVTRGSFDLTRPKIRRVLQRASALLLVAFGIRVLATVAL